MTFRFSLHSTGFTEIDSQHLNLDTILEFMMTCDTSSRQECLEKLIDASRRHFAFEEELLVGDKPFVDEEHRKEHRRLESALASEMEKVRSDRPNGPDLRVVAFGLSRAFEAHLRNFDLKNAPQSQCS